jgi:hypothetical protein
MILFSEGFHFTTSQNGIVVILFFPEKLKGILILGFVPKKVEPDILMVQKNKIIIVLSTKATLILLTSSFCASD